MALLARVFADAFWTRHGIKKDRRLIMAERKPGVLDPSDLQTFVTNAGANLIVVDVRNPDFAVDPYDVKTAEIPRRAWHASELEKDMVTWLHLHANDAISLHVKSDGTFEQTSLSSFWTDDELHDVLCFTSEGDHHAMVVILTMLYQNHVIQAEVRVYDWRGHAYDRTVHAPAVWGIVPAVTLCLGYTGNHYLSVVLDNYGHGGQRARFFELTARSGTLPGSMRPLPVRAVANQARMLDISASSTRPSNLGPLSVRADTD